MIGDYDTIQHINRLIVRCTKSSGASEAVLEALRTSLCHRLPQSYLTLMAMSNGIEGFISNDHYIILWRAEDLIELNRGFGDKEHAPGLVLIGSNGGDGGYGFDTRSNGMPLIEVPFIDMDVKYYTRIADTFLGFLEYLKGRDKDM